MSEATSGQGQAPQLPTDRPGQEPSADGHDGGRKLRAPRTSSAPSDRARSGRAPEAVATLHSAPAALWRSIELLDGQLLIRTNVDIQPARLADIAAVIELLPELLLRQERDLRGHEWRAQVEVVER